MEGGIRDLCGFLFYLFYTRARREGNGIGSDLAIMWGGGIGILAICGWWGGVGERNNNVKK